MPLNIFDGSSWNPFKKINIHDGSSWVTAKSAQVWDGTSWKLFSTGVPKNTVAPAFSQTSGSEGTVEQNLSVTTGTWENTPTSYRYVWEAAPYTNSTYNWQPLLNNSVAQTQSTAYVPFNYVGYLIRCKVYAINASGESAPYLVEPGMILGPQTIPVFMAYPVSDGRIYMLWQKSKGANGYYVQYQGPNVAFTELILPAHNEEPGTSVGTEFGNKYLDLGTDKRGTLGISIWPTNNSNPFSNVLGSRIQGGGKYVALSTIRTSTPPSINSSYISATQSAQYPSLMELRMNVSVGSYGSPAGTLDYYWGPGYVWNGGNFMLADRNGTSFSCTASITNSEGTSSSSASYTTDVYVPPAPVITWTGCEYYSSTTATESECSGDYVRTKYTETLYYRKEKLSDGTRTGQYDYNCTSDNSVSYGPYSQVIGQCGYPPAPPACVCNYYTTDTMSYHFAPESCPGGSQRAGSLSGNTVNANCPNVSKTATGTYQCKAYDVNDSASTNYWQCNSVGACDAPRNPDGSRAACYQ
jgi:hypothetical protein